MGRDFHGSTQDLLDMGAMVILEPPTQLTKLPENKSLICVVDTVPNILITLCDTDERLNNYILLFSKNFKIWMLIDTDKAEAHFV